MTTRRAASTGRLAMLAWLSIGLLVGCSSNPFRKMPLPAAAGFYQAASLTYRLDAGKLQQPLDVACVQGQSVVYEQVASSPLPDQSIGTLTLKYPHPAGRAGMAEVKFVLDSVPTKTAKSTSWNPFKGKPSEANKAMTLAGMHPEIHEVWMLDITSSDSDQVFKMLSMQGFYQTDRPGAAGTELTVTINGTEIRKHWDQIPDLNALVQRVRREGQLVSYVRPGALAGAPLNNISSPGVYRSLVNQTGVADSNSAAGGGTPNAFSMTPTASIPTGIAQLPAVTR